MGGRRRPGVPHHRAQRHRDRAPGARAQRPRRGVRARARPRVFLSFPLRRRRSARSAAPRPHRRKGRLSIVCASRCVAAATTRPATSPPTDTSPPSSSTSCSTPATTSTKGAPTPASPRLSSASIVVTRSTRVVDYRNRYALYKSDPDLRAAHASAPFIVTWDDHEVDNDYAGDSDEHDTPPEIFLLRRAAAYQAYYETMPLRPSTLPLGPSMRLYRRLRFGNLVRFDGTGHAAVPVESGLQRRLGDRLHRRGRTVADHPRRRSGALAVRSAGRDHSDVDGAGPAGADLRAQHGPGDAATRSTRWTSGTATPPPGSGSTPACARRGHRIRSCCRATCTSTTAPT